jgi:GTP-binding protein HflX
LLERPTAGPDAQAAVLVCLDFGDPSHADSVEEFVRLAQSGGAARYSLVEGRRSRPDPKFFAGSGKVEEIGRAASELNAAFVIFNHPLSGAQQRNLEKELGRRVLDREELILDIFAQRARTSEGKVQVELAQLEHLSTRLVRGWTHLERQRGGLGKTGGPGETQLELDRRYIARKMRVLKDKLEQMQRRRSLQRRARVRGAVFSVSLVGYTNAGKSSLFNALAHAGAFEADRLFATLDTTTRRIHVPEAGPVAVSDTVGFIRDLPHTLVASFRATLEETVHADLLLHVVDSTSAVRERQIADVNAVLREIGAEPVPQIEVWNKIDVWEGGVAHEPAAERDEYGRISRVFVSARTGAGLAELRMAMREAAQRRATAAPAAAAISV